MERREFIRGMGAGLIGTVAFNALPGCSLRNIELKSLQSRIKKLEHDLNQRIESAAIEKRIYTELPNHCHIAIYQANIETEIDGKTILDKRATIGMGVFLDDYYISMEHIPSVLMQRQANTKFRDPFFFHNIKNEAMFVDGKPFDILVRDMKKDILIAKERKGNSFQNFPCTPQTNINYLDAIYLIGNPGIEGTMIRKGHVSDLNSYSDVGSYKNPERFFGADMLIHGGDSGSPVVNDKFELLGLAESIVHGKFSYVNRISTYLDAIKDLS